MKININGGMQERESVVGGGNSKTFVSVNLNKERVILDKNGNQVSSLNPRQAQIIKRVDEKDEK